jgi:hypothetical protein
VGNVNISLRECALVTGRVLRYAGLPRGVVPGVRDAIVAAEAADMQGLQALADDFEHICASVHRRPTMSRAHDGTVLHMHGMHAFVAAPDVLDVAVSDAHAGGGVNLEVSDVLRPELLGVLEIIAVEQGLRLMTTPRAGGNNDERGEVRLTGRLATDLPLRADALGRLLRQGTDIESDLWWHLFHLGNRLLTPDSPVSRQHAGRSVLDENGEVLGEIGEDWTETPTTALSR